MRPAVLARIAVMLAALMLAGSGGGWTQTASQNTAITVESVLSADVAPFYYAVAHGLFSEAGLNVKVEKVRGGALAMTAVVGGSAEIGSENTLALTTAYARNIPIELIVPGFQYDVKAPHVALLAESAGPVKTPKDLEGRVIAVTGLHDLMALATTAWLKHAGVDVAQVHFVEMSPTLMASALASHRIDAVTVYDPYIEMIEQHGGRVLGWPDNAIGGNFLAGAWFGMRPWIATHREEVDRFIRVMREATRYLNAHHQELVRTIASYSKMSPAMIGSMGSLTHPLTMTPAMLQPLIDFAASSGQIAHPFKAQELMVSR